MNKDATVYTVFLIHNLCLFIVVNEMQRKRFQNMEKLVSRCHVNVTLSYSVSRW